MHHGNREERTSGALMVVIESSDTRFHQDSRSRSAARVGQLYLTMGHSLCEVLKGQRI